MCYRRMSLAEALLVPSLRVPTVTTPVHRAVLQIIMPLVVPFHKAVAADARTAALHTIETAKRD